MRQIERPWYILIQASPRHAYMYYIYYYMYTYVYMYDADVYICRSRDGASKSMMKFTAYSLEGIRTFFDIHIYILAVIAPK